jgi:hypothetical protein
MRWWYRHRERVALSSEKCGLVGEVVADDDFGESVKIRGVWRTDQFVGDKAIRQQLLIASPSSLYSPNYLLLFNDKKTDELLNCP